MARGRKPLPTKIKETRGTLEKRRVLNDEMIPDALPKIPEPPGWLSDIAKEEWQRVASFLTALRILSPLDLGILAMYCNEISVYIEMEEKVRNADRVFVYRDDNGKIKQIQTVAYQRIADRALEKALKIAAEFGFTPSSRTKISMGQAAVIEKIDNDPRKKRFDI